MQKDLLKAMRAIAACLLLAVFLFPTWALAQTHVVTPSDLQKETVAASQLRQRNQEKVREFLSSRVAEKAMKSAGMDPVQVKTAVSTLNDAVLAQLAARADKAQADFAAGRLSDRDLIFIILGIAALILIIVAVH